MTAQIAIYGRLGSEPTQRQGQSGKPWTTASIAVRVSNEDDAAPLWLQIVGFGRAGDVLASHAKGDLVSVSGRLQINRWRDGEGNDREQWQVVAEAIISARTVRPGTRRQSDDGEAGR